MQINLEEELLDLKGKPVLTKGDEGEPQTMGNVLGSFLMNVMPSEENDGDLKFKQFRLASKVAKGGILKLKKDDLELLVKLVKHFGSVLMIGRFNEMVNSTPENNE